MNDFDYDIVQKKRVARGAFAHVNRKRGKCRLPSDYLTAAQKKEMNGAVKTYNITRPMPLDEFKGMPDDLQREYLRNMQSCGGAATYLADEMGCCSATIREYGEKLGVPFVRGGRNLDLWQKKLSEWHTAEVTAAETPEKTSCVSSFLSSGSYSGQLTTKNDVYFSFLVGIAFHPFTGSKRIGQPFFV